MAKATPAASALLSNFTLVNYAVPFSHPAIADVADKYLANYADPPNKTMAYGYLAGVLWQNLIESACDAGDLSRDGIAAAAKKLTAMDTKGITAPLDFSGTGEPSSRASFILKPDAAVPGGLTAVAEAFKSKEAQKYKTPFQE